MSLRGKVIALLCTTCWLVTSCGSAEEGSGAVLTIDQALAAGEGQTVKVQGTLIATQDEHVLASVVLESYPPQAGGSRLVLKGLDLEALVGLSSTTDRPESSRVVWTDFPIVLEGVISSGVLEVKATPPVAEAVAGQVRVRFSPAGEPLAPAGAVWWVFDVTNLSTAAVDLTFPSGQTGEVTLFRGGTEVYRWSDGRAFLQAVRVNTLEPGRSMAFVLNDSLELAPGLYDVTATVAASLGPEGSAKPLPEIRTTITLR